MSGSVERSLGVGSRDGTIEKLECSGKEPYLEKRQCL